MSSAAAPPDLSLSLIIPTKSRQADLLETIDSIVRQSRRPNAIIIIDQSATSSAAEVQRATQAAAPMEVKYFWTPEIKDLVAARERGIAEASSEIVFFVDDDITLMPDCVERLIERYRSHSDIMGICGVDISGQSVPWWLVLARRAYMLGPFRDERSLVNKRHQKLTEPIRARLISGGLMSYRRSVFQEFRFEGALWGHRWNSSNDFSYRVSAKYPMVIDPLVRVNHRKPYGDYTPEEFVKVRVAGTFFFFSRNIKKNLRGWLAFMWVLVAIFIRSIWRGLQARALPATLRTFFSEVRRGIKFLREPFEAPY